MDEEVIKNLKNYKGKSILKRAAVNTLVKHLKPSEVRGLKLEFEKFDADHSGFLEVHELEEAIKNSNFDMTAQEIDDIIHNLDFAKNHKINYTEFISATINI